MVSADKKILIDIGVLAVSQVLVYFGIKWILSSLNPMSKRSKEAQSGYMKLMKRLGGQTVLNEYEIMLTSDVIYPEDIHLTWDDIGGLDAVIKELKELVILPFTRPDLFQFQSRLLQPPKGILLYGPPGCGKTMLAQVIAKESSCNFINLKVSSIVEKWYGESQKLVEALFSLAVKISPCIIFIDEIDSFLRERSSEDHEATAMMKAQFMSLWDGLNTNRTQSTRVIIIGATNRPLDVDPAILRRMPKSFSIRLPSVEQRKHILNVILSQENMDPCVDIDSIAKITEGFSGSALEELCRNAAFVAFREYLEKIDSEKEKNPLEADSVKTEEPSSESLLKLKPRPLMMQDFVFVLSQREQLSPNLSIRADPLD